MPEEFSFGEALVRLKSGKHVSRMGWNGKNMFVMLLEPAEPNILTEKFIAMSTVDGKLIPWVASQTDMLAEDWFVSI